MARKYDYDGILLSNLRKIKGGLKKDILQAKLEAAYLLHEAQEYKDEHGDLPLLNRVENYVGGARKIK